MLCHQIGTCQARGKGGRMKKIRRKIQKSSKRTKRNLQLSEESVGGRREKNVRLAQVAIFPCFDTSSSRIRSAGLLHGKRCRPPLTLFKGLLSTFVCNGQPSRVLRLQSARQLCCWQRSQAISPPPVLGFLPFFYFFTSWSSTAPLFFSAPLLFGTGVQH